MMLYKLVVNTDRRRFSNVVVSFLDEGPVKPLIMRAGIRVRTLGLARGKPSIRGLVRLAHVLRQERPAILQTWCKTADLIGLLVGRAVRVPTIAWNIRDSNLLPGDCSRLTLLARRACAPLSRFPAVLIANAHAGVLAHEETGYRPKLWRVIPNGFDTHVFAPDPLAAAAVRSEHGIARDEPIIGIVGRYNPMKDHANFIKAACILSAENRQVHYMMVGENLSPGNPALAQLLGAHPDGSRIHCLGPRRDVARLMAAWDLFTLSSRGGEGFPNVVGEAMACGVPCVVTSSAGDAATIVGDTGLVVPPGEPQALANAWAQLLDAGADARRALGHAARERVREYYGLEAVVSQYEALYANLGEDTASTRASLSLRMGRRMP